MSKRMQEFKKRIRENASKEQMNIMYHLDRVTGQQITEEDMKKCEEFFQQLSDILKDRYEVVPSCNQDISRYLIPIGTRDQVSYYGKPDFSFRISDHWNWYSSTKKCNDKDYIQCDSVDMPPARERDDEHATKARKGLQVAIHCKDGKYHHVFGYKWDQSSRMFRWVENDPKDICKIYGLA